MIAAVRLAALTVMATAAPSHAAPRTYANPIDLDYRYNWEQVRQGVSYRTGADPAIVRHRGAFYLFQTLADGYWRSTNLIDWHFIKPSRWPVVDGLVAPAVWSDGQRLYIKPSTFFPGPILISNDPEYGVIDFLTRRMPDLPNAQDYGREKEGKPGSIPPGPWDPQFFLDDDHRWYLYWGSSNAYPLYGIRLDPAQGMAYVGQPAPLVALDPARHGWERFGQDHAGTIAPFIEGAWMTKHAGRYYLQYGAPGTEFNVYATGAYVGSAPLGPLAYAPWNPVAYKPGGFVTGAGHGSTVEDGWGNAWLSGTAWIGNNWNFERRIDLFPARFWPDGQMAADTRFGDFPHYAATGRFADPAELFTGWMLLSYRKPVVASSTTGAFAASRVTDEDPRSFWVAGANRAGETLTVDLGGPRTVRAVQVDFADYKSQRFGDAPDVYTEFRLEVSDDGRAWREVARTDGPRRDRPNAYLELATPARARFVRYVHGHVGAATLAISDLRVFGSAGGPAPTAPRSIAIRRLADQRDAAVDWSAVPDAVGYNVRWGIRPDRLTQTYQRWADQGTTLTVRSLNVGQRYYGAIEAFDENGVSRLGPVRAF